MSKVVCIGSVLVDELFFCDEPAIMGSSNPATSEKHVGGVMANIVRNLVLLDVDADFIAAVGNDPEADFLVNKLADAGVTTSRLIRAGLPTGKYVSFLQPDGSLLAAVCDDACSRMIDSERLSSFTSLLQTASLIVADTNLSVEALTWLIDYCKSNDLKLIIETVSVSKSGKLAGLDLMGVFMITPNEDELAAICGDADEKRSSASLLSRGIEMVWVRKGEMGSVLYTNDENIQLTVPEISIIDSTGAGDAALAGWITAYLDHQPLLDCMKAGHCLAMETLQTKGAVSQRISKKHLSVLIQQYYSQH